MSALYLIAALGVYFSLACAVGRFLRGRRKFAEGGVVPGAVKRSAPSEINQGQEVLDRCKRELSA